jgi:hypothetical protein
MVRKHLHFTTTEWDTLSYYEQLMYVEGLVTERILASEDEPIQPPKTEIGKETSLVPRKIDESEIAKRSVSVPTVNWGPLE